MPVVTCIDDLRDIAKKRVARAIFEYVDCGAYTECTLRANRADIEAIGLRQRVGIDVDNRSTRTTMLGREVAMPVALAPIGLLGLNWANGEILAARAAHRFGVPFTLSTMSICSIEDVAEGTGQPFWFQLYVMRDRGFAASLIQRAKAAKCSALVLTLDLQIQGQRHRDLKNGLAVPPKLTWGTAFDVMRKPGWALNVMTSKRRSFGNLEGRIKNADSLSTLSQWIAGQFDPTLSWKDVEWVKREWGGPLVLKGILDVEDAKIAAQSGADAIVVSNHGGRQLDGAVSSIQALPEIAAAVGDRIDVWFDGGIRSGQSLLKALALGAKAVLLGRAFVYGLGAVGEAGVTPAPPGGRKKRGRAKAALIGRSFVYGLGAMGEAGVTRALEVMQKELDVTMALTGIRTIKDANPSILRAV